jgi:hypothetical protein
VLEDEVGLKLVAPDDGWRSRPRPPLAPPYERGENAGHALAREAGFRDVQHVSAVALPQRYFAGRTDGLRPPNNSEELLVATT